MSSILTNNGAMVALQTLKSINSDLNKTQSMISTGKAVASAKDNAAVWAISKVMEADVKGFKAISDSLSLGESTVAVAQNASETIADLLTDIKGKIVASQEENVDRAKIQSDIDALVGQVQSVSGAAQFNGLNLLSNTDTDEGSGSVSILSSLDRSGDGSVTSRNIDVGKQDLGTGAATAGAATTSMGGGVAVADGATGEAFTIASTDIVAGQTFILNGGSGIGITDDVVYVARDGDTVNDVVSNMVARLNSAAAKEEIDVSFAVNGTTASQIDFTNNTGAGITVVATDAQEDLDGAAADGTVGGGLEQLSGVDVSTNAGADAALVDIEAMIQTSIAAAAEFGSTQGRLETQSEFISKLTDSLKSGIGALVDADMEEASARLQALQVQQQLGIQSLSIANQAPQSILSLFR